ncbi:hypothetical protein G7Y89_g1219 [Cudoniella acicularis]|uniref:Uncharacterized protein n=1 Tax=Cudoniella acicularis TaxID=354080 RepID=A0A8H4W7M2_9HELO|nr:hypothetical protein G7Y89_g1219 [Cudoniella acicularis]
MRFATVILSSIFAAIAVNAQNATTTSAVVSGTAAQDPAQSSEAACLTLCAAGDATCRNKCLIAPSSPSNALNACINACPQGNGTAADNAAFLLCNTNCKASVGSSVATQTGSQTGSASAGATVAVTQGSTGSAGTGSGPTATSGGSTAGGVATASSGAATATKSSAASADNIRIGASLAGVVGVFAAVFAL